MSVVDVEGQRFTFPAGWRVLKYDNCSFHRNQFQSFAAGSKALDVVALAPDHTLRLVEVKDYRRHRRTKVGAVFSEVAAKVRATLAGLAVGRVRANDHGDKSFADRAMRASELRIVVHLDQPASPSRLFPQVIDPRSARTQLRKMLRSVDPHPICYGQGVAASVLPWTTVPI